MSVITTAFIEAKAMESALTTQYTSTTVTSVIDSLTVTNTSTSSAAFSLHIVPFGGTPTAGNLLLASKILQSNESYQCPELIGQALRSGDYIASVATAASTFTIRCSGRQIT